MLLPLVIVAVMTILPLFSATSSSTAMPHVFECQTKSGRTPLINLVDYYHCSRKSNQSAEQIADSLEGNRSHHGSECCPLFHWIDRVFQCMDQKRHSGLIASDNGNLEHQLEAKWKCFQNCTWSFRQLSPLFGLVTTWKCMDMHFVDIKKCECKRKWPLVTYQQLSQIH